MKDLNQTSSREDAAATTELLRSWRPVIETSRFARADLSERFFDEFVDLVRLCHCVRHWASEKRGARRMARSHKGMGWREFGERAEARETRARAVAAEKVRRLERIAASAADRRLVEKIVARTGLKGRGVPPERAEFAGLALIEFDGAI